MRDVRQAPLIERKRVLSALLDGTSPPIVYSEHIEEVDGAVARKS